jgi:hypothetical protein
MSHQRDDDSQSGDGPAPSEAPRVLRVASTRPIANLPDPVADPIPEAAPRVIAAARIDSGPQVATETRRSILRNALGAAAAATATATTACIPQIRSDTKVTSDGCCYNDPRGFTVGVRQVAMTGDGRHVVALSVQGSLRAWDLERALAPLATGSITKVRFLATGLGDRAYWYDGKLRGRRLATPHRDTFSVAVSGLLEIYAGGEHRRLVVGRSRDALLLHDGDSGAAINRVELPGGRAPDQVVIDLAGEIWARVGSKIFRLDGKAWSLQIDEVGAAAVHLGAGAERVAAVRGTQVTVTEPATGLLVHHADVGAVPVAFESWLHSVAVATADPAVIEIRALDGDARALASFRLSPARVTTLVGVPFQRGYAWGDSEGRVAVLLRDSAGQIRAVALSAADAIRSSQLAAAKCGADKSWVGWACTCNTVAVTADEARSNYAGYDGANRSWSHGSVPRGEKLPAGAICTCNTVVVGDRTFLNDACSCNSVCTCDTVCTCESVGRGGGTYTYTYWYPN